VTVAEHGGASGRWFYGNSGENSMATNAPAGDGHRNGAVRKRSQLRTKMMGEEHFTKRDKASGEFVAQKKDARKFKGVRKEARP
jgi:hypothetical protein